MISCADVNIVRRRRSYHTNIKFLAREGLLPEKIRKLIPKSNISRWRKANFSKVVGEKSSGMEISFNVNKIIKAVKKDHKMQKEFIKLIAKDERLFAMIKKERKGIYESYK